MELALFAVCAAVAIVFALVVVLHKDPIRSVLALVVTFFALAIIYVQLAAPLLAALQIIVYAGAILVLFLFVIMLLNLGPHSEGKSEPERLRKVVALVVSAGFGGLIASRAWMSTGTLGPQGNATPENLAAVGSVKAVAEVLFGRYLFAFELVSVVLLAALVGALVLTKREKA